MVVTMFRGVQDTSVDFQLMHETGVGFNASPSQLDMLHGLGQIQVMSLKNKQN